jgi:hypothetical protein
VIALLTMVVVAQAAAPAADKPIQRGDLTVGNYRLQQRDGGGYVWHGPRLTAFIAQDGRVSFVDERGAPGQAVAPVAAAAHAYKRATPGGGARSGGRSLLDSAIHMVTNPTLVVSDEDLRHDHHHNAKMDFLDATAALRTDMRAASGRKARGGALAALRQRVRAIAADEARPLPERHQLVFELWQECEDSAGGAQARAAIEDETRRQLPAGSPRAFTAAELAGLNAGQRPPFAPYR